MTRIDLDQTPSTLKAVKKRPALLLILLIMAFINVAAGVVFFQRRHKKSTASQLPPKIEGLDQPAFPGGSNGVLDNSLTRSAIQGSNLQATNLVKPKLSGGIAGVVNPDEEKKDKSYRYDPSLIPPPYDQSGMRIKPTRLRKIHEAGDSGWGYTSPAGFVEDPAVAGLWRSANALIQVTNAHLSKECLAVCGGEVLTVRRLKRSTASGKRTFTFKCNKKISLGGKSWKVYESTILHLPPAACIITTLAARSAKERQQANRGYFIMRRRMSPLPPQPPKPLFDGKKKSKKVPTLR